MRFLRAPYRAAAVLIVWEGHDSGQGFQGFLRKVFYGLLRLTARLLRGFLFLLRPGAARFARSRYRAESQAPLRE